MRVTNKIKINNLSTYSIIYNDFIRYYAEDEKGNIGSSLISTQQAIKNYKRNIKNRRK